MASFCSSCGAQVADGAAFCPACGKSSTQSTGGGAAAAPAQSPSTAGGLSDNAAGLLAYFVLPAIIFLIIEPYNKNRFVRFHSFQGLILGIAAFLANMILAMTGIGLLLTPFIWLGHIIVAVICMIKANGGQMFKLPLIGDFAEKQANS